MVNHLFSENSFIKKRARFIAILWTLLVLFLCLLPSNKIPEFNVPLIDKWVHFLLFGCFSFLWLLTLKQYSFLHLLFWAIITAVFGWFIEELQGFFIVLGRAKDSFDVLADAIGGVLGCILFFFLCKKTTPSRVSL